ncbi:pentatricopeptide repeat-containing protein 2, mitochondrial isoform X1 [Bombina bombina]|uniref:pentatricopeptide repeat-containing protein 2, mitochondrial isoform X1 n=1 Tax=Bombina bombina TaxID=8345 RepID=UPI00235AA735|nr:pentatricopeptide repeat-containing protein 2, mitochondrial isoform X1 [Bombina bombina]
MAVLGSWAYSTGLWTVGRSVFRTVSRPSLCSACRYQAKRYLLTEDILKLHDFQTKKLTTLYQIHGKKDLYFRGLEEKLQKNGIILKDELKTLLHLCQTPADVEFAKQVIYRYHEDNKNVIYGDFRFGPVFLRLCYELDLEDTAFAILKDQSLGGFFSDCTSYNILMDMLFTKGQYERASEVLVQMRNNKVKFSKETYILAFAICYKLNNLESCEICTTLLEEIEMNGGPIPRQAFSFAIAFALKRNEVSKAKSIFSQIINTDSKLCNNLNLLINLHDDLVEDALYLLEAATENIGSRFVKKPEFLEEVIALIGKKVQNTELHARFNLIYTKLQNSQQITTLTLDELLCFTPHEHKHSLNSMNRKKINHRTFRSLQSSLLLE